MAGAGIDYGMGTTNIDKSNGIRYGVIPANDVGQAWYDGAEADYGEPRCPKCGNSVKSFEGPEEDDWYPRYREYGCHDFVCDACEHTLDCGDCYGEDALGFMYSGDGYEMHRGGGSCDIFVLKSPYYTLAPYCSPCAPGACYLLSASEDGVRAYCLGHDWFDGGKAPYVVYSVESGAIVERNDADSDAPLQECGGQTG